MADSRDITGKNRKFKGTSGIVMPKGSTAERADTESGEIRFNTTTELMEYYDGNQWKPIDAPPTISSVTTSDSDGDNTILNADGSTLYTITINGGNFSLNPTVKFIGSTGTEYTAGNVTRVSGSQITCTTVSNMGTSDDPYDVQVINTSGLSATLDDAFSYNAAPVFATASGQLGTVFDGQVISGSTFNASATDAEGNTITYSILSGSLPGSGLTLSSSTGLITGTLSGTPSLGNYPFVVQAATTEGTIERQFSIQVIANPFIEATGGTVTCCGDYKIHTFTGPGTFTVTNAGTPLGSDSVDYLVVAGGGGGGAGGYGGGVGGFRGSGGGGAGGFRVFANTTQNPGFICSPANPLNGPAAVPVTAQGYPITVGGGGSGNGSGNNGCNGSNSTFSTITSAGGGGGGLCNSSNPLFTGRTGGSGGGSGSDAGGGATGAAGNTPPVSPPQGNPGGDGIPSAPNGGSAGGGGGALAAGSNGSPSNNATNGGAGGVGAGVRGFGTSGVNCGSDYYFSGGGGGGGFACGGTGGGGKAGRASPAGGPQCGTAATANTGGGGGGTGGFTSDACKTGGNGGSGIVIIRYKYQ